MVVKDLREQMHVALFAELAIRRPETLTGPKQNI
jgi:hypothetical protein